MGAPQYNVNRPGSTWFLPVGDVGLEWVNLLLSSYQFSGFYLQDPETDKPAGCNQWIRPGFLEVGFPIPTFDELALMLHSTQVACVVENMRLGCEALGVGGWVMGGYSDDLVLGAYPEVALGLGFSHLERQPAKNPSRTATCQGLRGVLEAHVTPSPWFPSAEALVNHVVNMRYAAWRPALARRELERALRRTVQRQDTRARARAPAVPHSRLGGPGRHRHGQVHRRQVRLRAGDDQPVRAKFSCQAHHVDLDYYRQFHATQDGGEPYLAPRQLLSHFRDWHPGGADPYERSAR